MMEKPLFLNAELGQHWLQVLCGVETQAWRLLLLTSCSSLPSPRPTPILVGLTQSMQVAA